MQHYQVDLIMLDFSKAFDTVAHKKTIKLEHYGIYSQIPIDGYQHGLLIEPRRLSWMERHLRI